MSDPTPRPWLRFGRLVYSLMRHKGDEVNRFTAFVQGAGSHSATDAELEANAALIVRAVNAHDALVTAVEAFLAAGFNGEAIGEAQEIGEAALALALAKPTP